MVSNSEPSYLRAIAPALPAEIASKLRSLCAQPANEIFLENFVRLLSGAKYSSEASTQLREQWTENQTLIKTIVDELRPTPTDRKRTRSEDAMDVAEDAVSPKRRRTTPNGEPSQNGNSSVIQQQELGVPLFALHNVSTTSPIRKKVDITVHRNALVLVNPSTKAPEATISLSNLKRAFVLPTRGKTKPHWTVILLSSDVPDNPKTKRIPGAAPSENQQVVFGLDANTAANFMTSTYNNGEAAQETHPKNSPTSPLIDTFLSHSGIPVVRPSASTFKSACGGVLAGSSASVDGIPGVEAYRAAKSGNLWFSEEGILWGESKPCEFWSIEDLISRDEGVRIVGHGAGRSCTVVLTRRIGGVSTASEVDDVGKDEEMGEETEFAMIDGKEREAISTWVRNHRDSFGGAAGKEKGKEKAILKPKPSSNGPMTIHNLPDESDDEDEAFEVDNLSDLDGSEKSSDSDDDRESENEAGSAEGDADGSGSGDDAEADDEVEELDPAHHPLLRPGAMPRMSRAALNMAAAIVEDAVTGGDGADDQDEPEEEGEDELED